MAPPFPPHSPGAAAAAARLQDMFTTDSLSGSKPEQYAQLAQQARALVAGERDRIANAANLSALVYHALPRSTGSASTSSTATSWWSARSRASRPASASRSARKSDGSGESVSVRVDLGGRRISKKK